jgi:GT2 family glycosyltransferase
VAAGISVVIPTFHRPDSLARTLEALGRQADERLGCVFVVNDAGTGPVPEEVPPALAGRIVRLHTPRRGPAFAANRALGEVTDELVAFLDDDSTPAGGWLHACLDVFDRHPQVTAQLGRIRWTGPPARASRLARWRASFIPRLRQKIYDSRHARFTDPEFMSVTAATLGRELPAGLPGLATHLSCGNAAVRMSFLRQHGHFDPAFLTYQDRELAWRILDRGELIAYNPAMVVHHAHNPSIRAALTRCWSAVAYQRVLHARYGALLHRLQDGPGTHGGRTRLTVPLTASERIYLLACRVVEWLARLASGGCKGE